MVDCGVNIGLSIFCFKKMFTKAKVIGFEISIVIYKETTLLFYQKDTAGAIFSLRNNNTIQVPTFDLKNFI